MLPRCAGSSHDIVAADQQPVRPLLAVAVNSDGSLLVAAGAQQFWLRKHYRTSVLWLLRFCE